MPTLNTPITTAWTKIAETSDATFLVTWTSPVPVEIATTTADSAPTVGGHLLTNSDALVRSVIGTGYVWAKSTSGNCTLVVSK